MAASVRSAVAPGPRRVTTPSPSPSSYASAASKPGAGAGYPSQQQQQAPALPLPQSQPQQPGPRGWAAASTQGYRDDDRYSSAYDPYGSALSGPPASASAAARRGGPASSSSSSLRFAQQQQALASQDRRDLPGEIRLYHMRACVHVSASPSSGLYYLTLNLCMRIFTCACMCRIC
jgi:hypothetical protein